MCTLKRKMFLFQPNDDILIAFRKEEIMKIPYVMDVVTQAELDAGEFSEPFPITAFDSKILAQIRHLFELQSLSKLPFECVPPVTILTLSSTHHTIPSYLIKRNNADLFKLMSAQTLIRLFHATSFLGCMDLRCGVCYEILTRLFSGNVLIKVQIDTDPYIESYLNYFHYTCTMFPQAQTQTHDNLDNQDNQSPLSD